ncbi:MAG: ribose 5-phosphate isomerase B [Anaerolineaceae bacterium]|nr:ribose 5-phosphate isomerase B [Anaerolineaceae bacterium]
MKKNNKMRIAIGCDHAGYNLKDVIIDVVEELGHQAIDMGTFDKSPVDYPDFAVKVGESLINGNADRGILLCGSGVGASISANKIRGIYAGVCNDSYSAGQGVEHDDMNVLCLGTRIIGEEIAKACVTSFLNSNFTEVSRHKRRVKKIRDIEAKYFC